jgi:spore maturation protein CgeB
LPGKLELRYFAHSWVSDWNHGNAHFLRGLGRALVRMGHNLRCYEQLGSWSLSNLIRSEGERAIAAIDDFRRLCPELDIRFYELSDSLRDELRRELREADVVIVHEWSEPALINVILELKKELGFRTLFHDTHHRAYTAPAAILSMNIHLFDGVLAFGDALRRIYREGFGIERVWTFHEAADIDRFFPMAAERNADVLWIGNWGDDERTRELLEFLVAPAKQLPDCKFAVHGVRYPPLVLQLLQQAGIEFRGYLPNLSAAAAYARCAVALHVPRHQYANGLSGVPTIRVFEALACSAPLICSPWEDIEGLFRAGEDFICVASGEAMQSQLRWLLHDDHARRQIGESGLATIRARHTCMHRAEELTAICEELAR